MWEPLEKRWIHKKKMGSGSEDKCLADFVRKKGDCDVRERQSGFSSGPWIVSCCVEGRSQQPFQEIQLSSSRAWLSLPPSDCPNTSGNGALWGRRPRGRVRFLRAV